jgi:hypothetical protein
MKSFLFDLLASVDPFRTTVSIHKIMKSKKPLWPSCSEPTSWRGVFSPREPPLLVTAALRIRCCWSVSSKIQYPAEFIHVGTNVGKGCLPETPFWVAPPRNADRGHAGCVCRSRVARTVPHVHSVRGGHTQFPAHQQQPIGFRFGGWDRVSPVDGLESSIYGGPAPRWPPIADVHS